VARLERAEKAGKDKGEAQDRSDKVDSKTVRMDRPEKVVRSGR